MRPAVETGEVDGVPGTGTGMFVRTLDAGAVGIPLVMIHGVGLTGRYFMPSARLLVEEHPVSVLDLPGYGQSPRPPIVFDVPAHARVVGRWLEERGRSSVLIGNSFGCQVAVEVAASFPKMVEGLVLASPTIDPERHSARQQMARLFRDVFHEKPSARRITLQDIRRTGGKRVLMTMIKSLDHHIEDRLPEVECPTLVLRGENDVVMTEDWARRAVRLLPRGHLATVANAAHGINYDEVEEFVRIVRGFLDRTSEFPLGRHMVGEQEVESSS